MIIDWTAFDAVGNFLAAASAVAAIYFSVRLVGRQILHQDNLEAARMERERILELKRLEESYLTRIFDVADAPYHATFDFAARLEAARMGRQTAFTIENVTAPLAASRELSGTTSAILHVLRASRRHRFPTGTQDLVFDKYESLVQTVIHDTTAMVKHVCENPRSDFSVMQSDAVQIVFGEAQLLKASTGKLIALLHGRTTEWNDPEFISFVESFAKKVDAKAL